MVGSEGAAGIHRDVLLVEDSPSDAALVASHLEGTHVDLHTVPTRAQAVALLGRRSFDAVLLDLGLPDGYGLATAVELVERFDVPLVVLTGRPEPPFVGDLLRRGVQDYVTKAEMDGPTLLRALRYAIGRHGRARQLEQTRWRLERFTEAVASDVSGPLAAIRGFAELIVVESRSLGSHGERITDYAERIVRQAREASERVEALLEDTTSTDTPGTVDLTAVARWVEGQLARRLRRHHAHITVTRLPRVEGDLGVLRQVFSEVLTHSLDHATASPPELRWASLRHDDGSWEVVLEDNGTDVGAEVIGAGQPVSAAASAGHVKVGRGLRQAATGMAEHGGTVWLGRARGGGMRVALRFPPG